MTHAGSFIILIFVVAIIFFISGYIFSKLDAEDDRLADTFEWNCELESIITELEEKINNTPQNQGVKTGMRRAIEIIEAHRRDYINEK